MELNVLTLRHAKSLGRLALEKLLRRDARAAGRSPRAGAAVVDDAIDVRAFLAANDMRTLVHRAEEYFSTLGDWTYHLAKPFSTTADAPGLLINFAGMIQGLRLFPGARVLDFGAGTGWTSRFLTQLGCEVVLVDVSRTALTIAQEVYRRQPVFGPQPPPSFLLFDGHHIALRAQSVDRILCFDSFHHTPNPDEVLREFARVLRPGGIAAFAEPGPHHSKSPQSQSEMKTYGVLENDIDVHAIWSTARAAGFRDLKINAYNIPQHLLSIDQYDDLLAGGVPYLRWAESTRSFLRDVRNFFLYQAGEEVRDSRTVDGLAHTMTAPEAIDVTAGPPIELDVTVANSGSATWLPSAREFGGVSLGVHLLSAAGDVIAFDHHWQAVSASVVPPGAELQVHVTMPPLAAGSYLLELDMVANRVAWFAQVGSAARRVRVNVTGAAAPASANGSSLAT